MGVVTSYSAIKRSPVLKDSKTRLSSVNEKPKMSIFSAVRLEMACYAKGYQVTHTVIGSDWQQRKILS